MLIARWNCEARFGYKQDVLNLMKEWMEQIGNQTNLDMKNSRLITGSVGAKEALIQHDIEIDDLADLDKFFDTIAGIKMHKDWGRKLSDVVVSGSTYWEVFRVVEL